MIYSSWNIECDTLKLVIMDHFLPFYPLPFPKNPKYQNFEKLEKQLKISSFYTCVPKATIMWGTVPEIQSETDKIFCHFGPFFTILSPNNMENQNFEKIKKVSGDVIILQMSTKNHYHMMYASWDMECNRHNFMSFWAIFCLFTQLLTPKIKIWKKYKKILEILSF